MSTTSKYSEVQGSWKRPALRTGTLRHVRDESGAVLVLALVFAFVVSLIVLGIAEWSGNDLKNTANFQNSRTALYGAGGVTQTAIAIEGSTAPTELSSALTSGQTYSVLNVSALPTTIPQGTIITVGTAPTSTVLQGIVVSSQASANATTIEVNSFQAGASEPVGSLINLGVCPGGGPTSIGGQTFTVWCNELLFPSVGSLSVTREVTFSGCLSSVPQQTCMQTNGSYVRAVVYYDDLSAPPANSLQCTSPSNEASCGTGVNVHSWTVQSGQT
jgi:hypothetical protein